MSSNGTLDHRCPNCAAALKFNPQGQNWKCEYCSSEFNREEIDAVEEKRGHVIEETTEEVKIEKDFNGMDVYSCPNCGAQIIADENTAATFCVYCKSTAILKNKLVGEFNPSKVIPFFKVKEDAIAAFNSIRKGRPFAPKEFSDKKNIEEMTGVYIPFWIYDINSKGFVQADAKRVKSWVAGEYRVTQTDSYLAIREGDMVFNKIPVDGSVRFDNDIMNSIEPFDYQGLVDFSHSYLSGFLAEKYDVDGETAITDAETRAKNSTTDVLKGSIGGYTSVLVTNETHNLNLLNKEYVLLPVWMLNIKYQEKMYTFAMNGQTGKMVGNIPIDKKKAIIWWISIFAITFAVCTLIWILGGM
jgi:hypothetical protein